jgi:hypothetical protein
MSPDFTDLAIVGLDDEASFKSDLAKKLFDVHLTLSATPPLEWAASFDSRWVIVLYRKKRRAWVSGDRIVIHCVPEEIEEDHLPQLKRVVAETNHEYRRYTEARALKQQQQQDHERREKENLKSLKGRLNFT